MLKRQQNWTKLKFTELKLVEEKEPQAAFPIDFANWLRKWWGKGCGAKRGKWREKAGSRWMKSV